MNRQSSTTTHQDQAGDYEIELFDHQNPKRIIVCSHGNGVRRWDGEKFFYATAEHFADSAVVLVDQNQPQDDGVRLNPLPVLVQRVEAARQVASQQHPQVPIVVVAHSMGCGIATFLDMHGVQAVVFVAPTAGDEQRKLIRRYGPDISGGKTVKTTDGLTKIVTPEYYASVQNIVWEREYQRFVQDYRPVYVFAAGDEEIVGPERLAHAALPFAKYELILGARHNFVGQPLDDLFARLDTLPELTP